MEDSKINQLSGGELAYIGDAVLETLVRNFLLENPHGSLGQLNASAVGMVRASAQSEALAKIEPYLTETERNIFHRGRNANGISIPKSSTAAEYRRATGFEALFGYLYLIGSYSRMKELFGIAYKDISNTEDKQ